MQILANHVSVILNFFYPGVLIRALDPIIPWLHVASAYLSTVVVLAFRLHGL